MTFWGQTKLSQKSLDGWAGMAVLSKIRSCYSISITSNQADKKNIRSKNNNKIAGIAESVKDKKEGRILWF